MLQSHFHFCSNSPQIAEELAGQQSEALRILKMKSINK